MMECRFQTAWQNPLIERARQLADTLNARIFLVGGAVRDVLMDADFPLDLDFAVLDAPARDLAVKAAEALDGRHVLLDEAFGIHRVVFPETGITLDFSDALDNSLERDLARRDLTINAIALDPVTGAYHDPFQGRRDLSNRVIRMVSADNLREDPLRLLRVFRFGARIQALQYDPATLDAVRQYHALILEAAPERILVEFLKLLDGFPCFPHLDLMGETGLLEAIVPELKATRAVPPNGHHHLGLFEHTLELVRQAETLFGDLPDETRESLAAPFSRAVTRFGLIKLACLLHDIGKPATMQVYPDKRTTYYGHDAVSETMTEAICERLRMSNDMADYLKKLVRWHLYPCQFGADSPRKSILRFFRRMGAETPDVLLLALADRFSTRGEGITEEALAESHAQHLWLMRRYREESATLNLPRLLNGHDVIELLRIPPGPGIREILDALQEAHQLGEVTTAEEAKSWVLSRFGT